MAGSRNNGAILGAIVAVVAITGAVILLAQNDASVVAFLGVVSPTIVAMLALMKTEAVQNQVSAVADTVDELTNGKMNAAVQDAVSTALGPVVEQIEHVTDQFPALKPEVEK